MCRLNLWRMPTWDQESALREADELAAQARALEAEAGGSEHLTAWAIRMSSFLSDVFGEDSDLFKTWRRVRWRPRTGIIGGPARPDESWDPQLGIERMRREAIAEGLNHSRGVLAAARQRLERETDLVNLHQGHDTAPEASLLIRVINLAEHKLRKIMRDPPANERALQEEFEKLLIGADVPYSRESKRIEYSTKSYVPDFTIDKAGLAIELKVCLDAAREKQLPAEINDDILAYKREYPNMLFVVYDNGHIRDVDRFAAHFEEEAGVIVRVVKH